MKKLTALLLVVLMLLPLIACGGAKEPEAPAASVTEAPAEPTEAPTPEPTPEPEPEYPQLKLGETASTNIVDFQMTDAKLCYYASATSNTFAEPRDASDGGIFAARTGTTYVVMTFTMTNKDRGGSLDIASSFGGNWPLYFTVDFDGESYRMYGFDLNYDSSDIHLDYAAESHDGGKTFQRHSSGNELLHAGETLTLRVLGIVKTDPEDLNTPFGITVNIPNSSGDMELFTYNIGR